MHSRTDAFKLWWWRRLLTVPWTAWRLSKSIPKEINPEYSPEGLMLKLKPQYFGHLMQRTDLLEKTLMLGKIEGRRRGDDRRQDGWMALLTQTHVHWVGDAIQPSHPLSSPSPPTFNLFQHQGPFQWVSSLHLVAKVLECQLQHQSFWWIFRTDFL